MTTLDPHEFTNRVLRLRHRLDMIGARLDSDPEAAKRFGSWYERADERVRTLAARATVMTYLANHD